MVPDWFKLSSSGEHAHCVSCAQAAAPMFGDAAAARGSATTAVTASAAPHAARRSALDPLTTSPASSVKHRHAQWYGGRSAGTSAESDKAAPFSLSELENPPPRGDTQGAP